MNPIVWFITLVSFIWISITSLVMLGMCIKCTLDEVEEYKNKNIKNDVVEEEEGSDDFDAYEE